ncbi:hypothetical protein [Halomontanus rarus]|uniref:hypothetical protein n=1 Tax=Halomontanus rarus TaxID=3034020 RepID=UPI0023E8C330|nr:hypothetical protein [Halovivax sp. TS33]
MVAKNASPLTKRAGSSSLGGLVIVLASIVLSIVSYGLLADTVRIRWMIGTYQHHGPEHASTMFVLVMFPLVIGGLYIVARWLRTHLERADGIEDFDEFRAIYDICVLLILGIIVVGQLVIIALNL